MADERDPKVSRRYGELGAEEPPRALDQSILAAAHRAVDQSHAPLVTPAGRHRWYFPLAAAAILVLAVAVTVQIERQQPDPEAAPTPPAAPAKLQVPPAKPTLPAKPAARPKLEEPAPAPLPAAAPESRASAGAAADAASPRRESMEMQNAPRAMARQAESPERWLERIVQLRKDGKHDEADKALAEFRKRYPDYRIPEAALPR